MKKINFIFPKYWWISCSKICAAEIVKSWNVYLDSFFLLNVVEGLKCEVSVFGKQNKGSVKKGFTEAATGGTL